MSVVGFYEERHESNYYKHRLMAWRLHLFCTINVLKKRGGTQIDEVKL